VANKSQLAECPVPAFLAPVEATALTPGADMRKAYHQRTAELVKANSRIVRAKTYIRDTCSAPKARTVRN